jgi:tRNA(Ile)-lysidine synthase
MALALLCARWMAQLHGHVHAVCVDHGLRDGSFDEARQSVEWAQALGLTAEIIKLNLGAVSSRLQERAREGRHRALVDAAHAQGAGMILLAHTRDDQNETVALRLASKTGLDGLAGMAAMSPSPFPRDDWPCFLGRPLLGANRRELRILLGAARQSWHEDPSNNNTDFARIRARQRLVALHDAGADVDVLSQIAAKAALLRSACDTATHQFLNAAALQIHMDHASLAFKAIADAPDFIVERALGWLSFAVADGARLPQASKITRLANAIKADDFRGATLAGASFKHRGESLLVSRAPARRSLPSDSQAPRTDISKRLANVSGSFALAGRRQTWLLPA